MTSQAVEGTWMRTGGYGRLRGELVKCWSYFSCKFTWLFFISSMQACSLLIFVIGSTILLLTDLTVTCRIVPSHQLSSTLMNTIIYYQWLLGKLKRYILLWRNHFDDRQVPHPFIRVLSSFLYIYCSIIILGIEGKGSLIPYCNVGHKVIVYFNYNYETE